MTQLSYEPAFDPYHTIFRLHRLMISLPNRVNYRVESIRILDFYLLFPYLIKEIRLKVEHRSFKKIATGYEDRRPYGRHPNAQVLFSRMEPIQKAALSTMAIEGYLDLPAYEKHEVSFLADEVPTVLYEKCMQKNSEEENIISILSAFAIEYELLGPNGLKARTTLMEHRNDAI